MNLKIECYIALCELSIFEINGIKADYHDFGEKCDQSESYNYGCGNMKFEPKFPTQEVLDKYEITLDEYYEVCKELDVLSFGECGCS